MSAKKNLKKGWTTGACAAAAAKAAAGALCSGTFADPVTITLPKGLSPSFVLHAKTLQGNRATASVIKDAGDDPDVTHGAEIKAVVERTPPGSGLAFIAGEGVGTITRPGLALPPGEPAVNPGPRRMIAENIAAVTGGETDFAITLSIPGGEALAAHTLNRRLGIEGGLSILGTTGVVVPYSCSAWVESIHRGIDVARASGFKAIAAATGRTSETAVKALLGLPDTALIEMGDFPGALLKYLCKHPVDKLTIAGGFAKLAKFASGELDLHSKRSSLDLDRLGGWMVELGGKPDPQADTGSLLLAQAEEQAIALGDKIASEARGVALDRLAGKTEVEVLIFDRQGRRVGHAG